MSCFRDFVNIYKRYSCSKMEIKEVIPCSFPKKIYFLIVFQIFDSENLNIFYNICYLLSILLVLRGTYRAFTEVFHCCLSAAIILVSSHDFHPASLRSFSTVRRHVVFGLPRLLFPSRAQLIAMLESFLRSCLKM